MKALVVGGSGMVGGALLRTLMRVGIVAVGTCWAQSRPGMRTLKLPDKDQVKSCFDAERPDVVFVAVNTPGGADFCEDHAAEPYALNVQGTTNLMACAAEAGSKVVYYSSDYVFDGAKGPYREEDQPCPINVYGRTKWEAEEIIRAATPEHLIIRTTAVFGWDRTSRNFAMQVWEHLQAGNVFRVPEDQLGNPTLSDYLAEASVRLVQNEARGTFNIVGKDLMPRSELGKALARTMALDPDLIVPVPTVNLGQRAPRPLRGGLIVEKLEKVLNTEPLALHESLKRFRRQWRSDTYVGYAPTRGSGEAEDLKRDILNKVKQYHQMVHQPPPFIPYETRVQYSGRVYGSEEMINLIDSSLDFWLTLGPYGDLFEHKMKEFFAARDFVLVNSGSSANLTAVLTLLSKQLDKPLQPGDEVITPAVTFPTTLAPLVHSGLIPVFVDCEVGTYNVNPALLEDALSHRTRAIMIPHTLGNPCDMDIICDLAQRYDLYLIEDTCDALGSTFRGKLVGTFGDLATLSFFPAHHITMGEGGGVVVNNPRLSRIVRSVRDWGRDCWCAPGESNTCGKRFGWELGGLPKGYDHKYIYSNLGYNFKPTDMQAAIGVAQMERIPEFIRQRRSNFSRLYEGLQSYQDWLVLPKLDARSEPSWFALPITVQNGLARSELIQWLEKANIETREVFGGDIRKQPGYMDIPCRVHGSLPETHRVMNDTFFIGVYPGLTETMIEFILDRVAKFFAR